jgi:hypothetical protein
MIAAVMRHCWHKPSNRSQVAIKRWHEQSGISVAELIERLAHSARLTVDDSFQMRSRDTDMAPRSNELPKTGFALEIDGLVKTEFKTREGAESGAIELKRRFPSLRIRLYDAQTQSRHEIQD